MACCPLCENDVSKCTCDNNKQREMLIKHLQEIGNHARGAVEFLWPFINKESLRRQRLAIFQEQGDLML